MLKPLNHAQADFLRHVAGAAPVPGMTSRGLVSRGLLAYKWGRDPSFGYTLTAKGRRVLEELQ